MQQCSLALHTSSPEFGLAWHQFGSDIRHRTWDLGRSLSTHLHAYLAEFVAPQSFSDLAFIAVAKGPGSFTGTRLGMVTARTLGQQLEIPVFAISTLAAIVHHQARQENYPSGTRIAVTMKAVRGKIFVAVYEVKEGNPPVEIWSDRVEAETAWPDEITDRVSFDTAIVADGNLGNSVTSLLDIANWKWQQGERPHWSSALPFYGQHPVR